MKYLAIIFTLLTLTAYSKTLTICHKDTFKTLDPHLALNTASVDSTFLKIYEPIVKRVGQNATIIPLLISDWSHNNDFTQWSFQLREGVSFQSNKLFSPTRFLESQDIKFSFERSKNKEKIKIIDKKNFKIILNIPNKNLIENLLSSKYAIMSKEYFESLEKLNKLPLFTKYPIGTGPFEIKKITNSSIEYIPFKKYYLGEILFEKLTLLSIPLNLKRMDMLNSSECDISNNFSQDDLSDLHNRQQYRFLQNGTKRIFSIVYRNQSKQKINLFDLIEKLALKSYKDQYLSFKSNNFTVESKKINKNLKLLIKKYPSPHYKKFVNLIKKDFAKYSIKLNVLEVTNFDRFLEAENSYDTIALIDFSPSKNQELLKLLCESNPSLKWCLNQNKISSKLQWKYLFDVPNNFVINKSITNFFPQLQKAQDYSTILKK